MRIKINPLIFGLLLLLLPLISLFPIFGQNENHLPVLLIHGYNSNSLVWTEMLDLLEADGIYSKAVTFPIDDVCGSSASHADQLIQIVDDFKSESNSDK
ncbi:MAG: esterase/lipase family protein [Nitrososphaeraceae archaeon]